MLKFYKSIIKTNILIQIYIFLFQGECLLFISMNPDIMNSELFEELPQNLQAEIYDQVIWVKPR